MADGPRRYRFAIAAFYEPGDLWDALNDLLLHDFTNSGVCLLGTPSAVERFMASADRPAPEQEAMRTALRNAVKVELPNHAGPILVSCTPILEWLVAAEARGRRLLSAYKRQIADGAAVLIVSSATVEQHDKGSNILLRHSVDPISVEEFTQ